MIEIINNRIRMPLGDTGSIDIGLYNKDGTDYTMQDGDKVLFMVKSSVDDTDALITKEAVNGVVSLNSGDTKALAPGVCVWGTALINAVNNTKDSFIPVEEFELFKGVVST